MTKEIRNLEDFLADFIEPNEKVISSNVERLTAPGENYLSLVLKVDVTLLNQESGIQKQFSGVAKCFNPRKEKEEEKFRTFEKENYVSELTFYKDIVPTLSDFAKERGLAFDIFPKLIGYRPNLHGKTDDVDDDSIILLENLKLEGKSSAILSLSLKQLRCLTLDRTGYNIPFLASHPHSYYSLILLFSQYLERF